VSIIPFRVYEALFIAKCICPFLSPNLNSDTLMDGTPGTNLLLKLCFYYWGLGLRF